MLPFPESRKSNLLHTVVLLINTLVLMGGFYSVINFASPFVFALAFVTNIIALHYLMNIVHISSHSQLSHKLILNRILGMWAATLTGLTFDDFRSTHILHHKFPDTDKDPDKEITLGGSLTTIPFRVWFHDRWFWKKGLWKKRGAWKGYFVNRIAQVLIVTSFFIAGFGTYWLIFWLLPVLFVGYGNAFFLFFFPHYNHRWEAVLHASPNPLFKTLLWTINMSRYYHELHHDNTRSASAYYPLWSYLNSLENPLGSLRKSYVFNSDRTGSGLDKVAKIHQK